MVNNPMMANDPNNRMIVPPSTWLRRELVRMMRNSNDTGNILKKVLMIASKKLVNISNENKYE